MQKYRRLIFPAVAIGFLLLMGGWFLGRQSMDGVILTTQRAAPAQVETKLLLMQDERIDLNRATEDELQSLPGIGPVLAQRIVAYRSVHGPFQYKTDLMNVDGIGEKTFSELRDRIYLEDDDENTDH